MEISSLGGVQSSAMGGLQAAQGKLAEAANTVASGVVDPAVIVDITSAQIDFAANAKVFEAAQDNTKRLLDMLA